MVQHTAILTMANYQKVVYYDLSNDAIFNDLERPIGPNPRFKVMLFSDGEYIRNRDIVSMKY